MKIIYIHARPHGHPLHNEYGKSVASESIYRDFKIRWHDIKSFALSRYLSWVVCAFSFPNKKGYDVFYSDGLVYFLVIMRKLKLINKNQKIIGLLDDETLYFLKTKRYSKVASALIKYTLNAYDGFICVGNFQTTLLKEFVNNNKAIRTIYNGVEDKRSLRLMQTKPNLKSKNILFIGNIMSENRAYYKGLDFLLKVFEKLYTADNRLRLIIIGEISESIKNNYLREIKSETKENILFKGQVQNIEDYLEDTLLYLHCSNGESWGISVQEAMFSGVVPFVSDLTGVCELVEKVEANLVFKTNDLNDALLKINNYINLSEEEKVIISEKCRKLAQPYTYSKATEAFKKALFDIVK